MNTYSGRALSERDRAGMRELRDYAAQLEREQRTKEDRESYRVYVEDLNAEQLGTPPALRVPVLSFEEWSKYLPDGETDPIIRRTLATYASLQDQNRRTVQKQAEGTLSDETLASWSFDLTARPEYADDGALRGSGAGEAYQEFLKTTPSFDHDADWDALQSFFARNRLTANLANFTRAWEALTTLNLVPKKPAPEPPVPDPEPARSAPDPEQERQRRRRDDYFNKVIKVDPVTKQTYTEAQLDKLSADEYKKVMIGEFKTLTMADVIDRWAKF